MTQQQSGGVTAITRAGKQWNLLTRAASFLVVLIGTFWALPPGELFDRKLTQHFAEFMTAVVTGMMVLPMMKWCCTLRHAWLWLKIGAACLLMALSLFFVFEDLKGKWTVPHAGKVIYIGSEVRPEVAFFVQKNAALTEEELLEYAAWDPAKIWTERSLLRCRMTLTFLYVMTVPFFVIAILSVGQILYCSKGKPEHKPREKKKPQTAAD